MNTWIPVLVRKYYDYYSAQLLFFPEINGGNQKEWKALDDIQREVKKKLDEVVTSNDTVVLNQLLFAPSCQVDNFHIRIEASNYSFDIWLPIVYWSEEKHHYLYCPLLEKFRYEHSDAVLSVETVQYYFQCWIRTVKKDSTKEYFSQLSEQYQSKHTYNIRLINVQFNEKFDYTWIKNAGEQNQQYQGLSELEAIAEAIDYRPDSYEELVYFDDFVNTPANDKLYEFYGRIHDALIDSKHRKGILVVGQELTGRSFAIETVLRTIQRNINYKPTENKILVQNDELRKVVWKLSGSGIISGMAHVGQWEARAEAIFSYATSNNLILYFESLLDLTEAGKSSTGSLSVADALLTYMKDRKIRVVSKITPTQLVKLRERNRSLVNQFEILTMPALNVEEQLRIYINKVQNWNKSDNDERSPFEIIPYMTQLVEWTNPNGGVPGSICKWLDKIAETPSDNIQTELLSQMGANFPLLKNCESPNYQEIKTYLANQVIGQEEAIDALTNWTLKFQGLLSDPGRPAASMLFLGPTGVGKTESAKAVAKFLYKDDSHFLRFDCNELNSAYAVSRLVGSNRNEGTLTNAVRLEPFSVVLFDEIEKAHPAFHDLLLQILGEGRLTDGKGRTTSFKNCFIILTSNLGANQAGHFAGFGNLYQNDRDTYFKALERFFRPEFINRLDKVVPFNRLENAELELIAKKFIDQIRSREGFQKRKALLSLSSSALDWLVQQGHDPKYGARQTQRSLEKILVEPLSAFFAQSTWDTISVIEIGCENDKLTYSVSPIAPSKKPKGTYVTPEMFKNITSKEYNILCQAFEDWSCRINHLFISTDSPENNVVDWTNLDELSHLRIQILEELDKLKENMELDASISAGDLRAIENKMYHHTEDPGYDGIKIVTIPKTLSAHEWELLIQSESGVYPQNVKLADVEPYRNNWICNYLRRCSTIHQLLGSEIPQSEEALVLIFSTGEFTDDTFRDVPVIQQIEDFTANLYSPLLLDAYTYNSSQRGAIRYCHARGLGAYKRLQQHLTGAYVTFDDNGHLSRADSIVILPYDSKEQTQDECIEKYLESNPNVWKELRYMYMGYNCYESRDTQNYIDLPPELEQALLKIKN